MSEKYTPVVVRMVHNLQFGRGPYDIWKESQQWRNSVATAVDDLYIALCQNKDTGEYYEAPKRDSWGHPWKWFRLTEKGRRAAFNHKNELVSPWADLKPIVNPPYMQGHKQPKQYLWPKVAGKPNGQVVESRSPEEDNWCLRGGPTGDPGLQIPYMPDRDDMLQAAEMMAQEGYVPVGRRLLKFSDHEMMLAGANAASLLTEIMGNISHVYAQVSLCLTPQDTLWAQETTNNYRSSHEVNGDFILTATGNRAPWTGADTPCYARHQSWVSLSQRAAFERGFQRYLSELADSDRPLFDRFLETHD